MRNDTGNQGQLFLRISSFPYLSGYSLPVSLTLFYVSLLFIFSEFWTIKWPHIYPYDLLLYLISVHLYSK